MKLIVFLLTQWEEQYVRKMGNSVKTYELVNTTGEKCQYILHRRSCGQSHFSKVHGFVFVMAVESTHFGPDIETDQRNEWRHSPYHVSQDNFCTRQMRPTNFWSANQKKSTLFALPQAHPRPSTAVSTLHIPKLLIQKSWWARWRLCKSCA